MIERLSVGPIGENAYVLPLDGSAGDLSGGGSCILVDPGDEGGRILGFLDSRNLVPEIILLTHGHLDHTAAIPELMAAWTGRDQRPRIAIHRDDAPYLGSRGEETNRRVFVAIRAMGYFRNYWRPLPEPDILLEDGDFLPASSWRVIHTPGHTAGSICLYDESRGILISGDTLFREGVGRADGPDSDPVALERSISSRLFSLPEGTSVFPGHGEPTTIGRERY